MKTKEKTMPHKSQFTSTTALAHWLSMHGMTTREFGRRLGDRSSGRVNGWVKGTMVPSIVIAYEIERLTEGAVPMEAWLSIPMCRGAIATLRAKQPPEYQPKNPPPEHVAALLEEEAEPDGEE
jgi:hypothetical protein